jgi:hypothetical protein
MILLAIGVSFWYIIFMIYCLIGRAREIIKETAEGRGA